MHWGISRIAAIMCRAIIFYFGASFTVLCKNFRAPPSAWTGEPIWIGLQTILSGRSRDPKARARGTGLAKVKMKH